MVGVWYGGRYGVLHCPAASPACIDVASPDCVALCARIFLCVSAYCMLQADRLIFA